MIVYEWNDSFELIEQHEHARISAIIGENWADPQFMKDRYRSSVLKGIREHDRAWIRLDQSPRWNKEKNRPYSFVDYPLAPKVQAYTQGIEELLAMDAYAGLLSSLHYSSFFTDGQDKMGTNFLRQERKRQSTLRKKGVDRQKEQNHLTLLQFCDDLSLYICLNRPGASKREETMWFRTGFRQTFDFIANETIIAHWKNKTEVIIHPFPFIDVFSVHVKGKLLKKESVYSLGLEQALSDAEPTERFVTFRQRT